MSCADSFPKERVPKRLDDLVFVGGSIPINKH
jgi:hypothetical protein